MHEDIDEFERWKLVAFESPAPLALTASTDANGVARRKAKRDRRRARVSGFYFKDRVEPVTPAELAAAHHHGEHEAIKRKRPLVRPRPRPSSGRPKATDRHTGRSAGKSMR